MYRIVFILLAVCCVGCSPHKREVARALEKYDGYLLHLEADSIANCYLPDGVLKGEGQPAVVGPDSIRSFLKVFKGVVVEQSSHIRVTKIEGDSAVQQGTYRQVVTYPSRRQTLELGGEFEAVWVNTDAAVWKLRRMQTGNYTSKEFKKQ